MHFFMLQNCICSRILEDRRRYKMHLGFNMFILSNLLTYVLQQLAIHGWIFYSISPLFCKVIVSVYIGNVDPDENLLSKL